MTGTCPQCYASTFETQRFCRYCGHRLIQGLTGDENRDSNRLLAAARPNPVNDPSEYPTAPMPVGRVTTRLRAPRQRFPVFYGLLAAALLAGFCAGFVFEKVSPVRMSQKMQIASEAPAAPLPPTVAAKPTLPTPPHPPAPPLAESPRSPLTESRKSPRSIHRQDSQLLLGQMLSSRVALTERKIAELRRHADSLKSSRRAESHRQALLEKISALEQERLALVVAAEALDGKTLQLQKVLQNAIPTQAIFQRIINERIGKIPLELKLDLKPVTKLCETKSGTGAERIDHTIEQALDDHSQRP